MSLDFLRKELLSSGVFGLDTPQIPWRISPHPFPLTPKQFDFFTILGDDLLRFYLAVDELLGQSLRGERPAWIYEYLTMRIDSSVRELGRTGKIRDRMARVIRPDVLLTKEGQAISELDSVPGGIGWTGALSEVYEKAGFCVVGAGGLIQKNFAHALGEEAGKSSFRWAIVVSDESFDYWHEMVWLGRALRRMGLAGEVMKPEDLRLYDGGLAGKSAGRIDVLYRFFELFDCRNLPTWGLLEDALKNDLVGITPPIKSHLEEKLLFALFHDSCLEDFWNGQLGVETCSRLKKVFPMTWILDPRVRRWKDLFALSQKQRRLVIKPSGYSPLAWGSRGVIMGHDQPQERWAGLLRTALDNFQTTPYVLQQYCEPRRVPMRYYRKSGECVEEEGRVRLCPYYMVYGGKAHLSGILATICPLDKKLIHGMKAAVMAPCAVDPLQ